MDLIWIILDYPWSAIVGLRFVLKFGLDRIYSFGDIAIFLFCRFGLKLSIHAHSSGFWGYISPKWRHPPSDPHKALTRKHVVWAIKRKNRFSGSTWARSREKWTGHEQDSQTKSHKVGDTRVKWLKVTVMSKKRLSIFQEKINRGDTAKWRTDRRWWLKRSSVFIRNNRGDTLSYRPGDTNPSDATADRQALRISSLHRVCIPCDAVENVTISDVFIWFILTVKQLLTALAACVLRAMTKKSR